MRRQALDSAILAKILGSDLLVVEGLSVSEPKTKAVAEVLNNLKINRSCLVTIPQRDEALWKSARNIPDVTVRVAANLSALDVSPSNAAIVNQSSPKAFVTTMRGADLSGRLSSSWTTTPR